jgi:hypothetical protein
MAWSELDLAKAMWTIPEERAKGKRDHPVALMGPVLDIFGGIPRRAGRDLLFGSGLRPFSGLSCAKKSLDGRIAKAGFAVIGGLRAFGEVTNAARNAAL